MTKKTPKKTWTPCKVPRMLYMPLIKSGTDGSFDNTGMRIEADDELELMFGSNRVRVNGVEYRMLISCDKIRIDKDGFLQLDPPQPPSASTFGAQGEGNAYVGRTGTGQGMGQSFQATPDRENPSKWRPQGHTGNRRTAAHHQTREDFNFDNQGFDESIQKIAGPVDPNFDHEEAARAFEEWNGFKPTYKTITLKDGSKAKILIDPKSGKEIGTPFRMYQGIGLNPDEAAAAMQSELDQQNRYSNIASSPRPTTGNRNDTYRTPGPEGIVRSVHDALAQPRTASGPEGIVRSVHPAPNADPRGPQTAPTQHPEPVGVAQTGVAHLDNLLGGPLSPCPGYPIGKITHLYGDPYIRKALGNISGAVTVQHIEVAFGKIALLKPDQPPIVIINIPNELTDQLRLMLADQLPVLADVISSKRVAVVISTPDWQGNTPPLLKFIPELRLWVTTNDQDPRFMTACVVKSSVKGLQGHNATFPRP